MRRKIIAQGAGGCTISLPIDWIREQKLKAGDDVLIERADQRLLLSATQPSLKEARITITGESEHFTRVILNDLYRLGYDRIHVSFNTPDHAKQIRAVAEHRLPGFEVVEENQKHMLLESMSMPEEEKQDVILRRLFLLIHQSLQQFAKDLEMGTNSVEELLHHTRKCGQYDNILRRMISKYHFIDERSTSYWHLYTDLLLIEHSVLHASEMRTTASSKLAPIAELIAKQFYNVYDAFFRHDIVRLERAHEELKVLQNSIIADMPEQHGEDVIVAYYLAEQARRIYLMESAALAIVVH